MQSHRWQPTRFPRPWDSPGKNTGVGSHFLVQCMKVKLKVNSLSPVRLFLSPWTVIYQAPPSMGFFQARLLEWVAISFSRFHVLVIVNRAAMNMSVHLSFWIMVVSANPVGLLGGMVVLFSVFYGTYILSPKVAMSIYIPTNNSWGHKESDMTERLNWTELNSDRIVSDVEILLCLVFHPMTYLYNE